VGVPAHLEVADEIARRAVTLLRNERDLLPLLGTRSARVLSVALRRSSDLQAGRGFDAVLRERYPRLSTVRVAGDTRPEAYEELLERARRSDLVIVSLYVNWTQASADEPLPEDVVAFIEDLGVAGIPHAVVSFGNPYLLREVPGSQAYLLAWSGSEASQRAAASALFGEAGIDGRTPIQLPPFFYIGDGLSPAPAAGGGR
jgi:beta-N-acetylhexosaminidase